VQIEISSDAEYAAGISMAMAFPSQRLLPGMVLTAIDGVDQGTRTYQQVIEQITALKGARAKLAWAPRSDLNASQLLEFDMPYAAKPGDRIRALTPDGMKVEVVFGGDASAHAGEVYMVLMSRTIPLVKNEKRGYAQTIGELQLITEMSEIKTAIERGDSSRSVEFKNLQKLRNRVKQRGLKSEIQILRNAQENILQEERTSESSGEDERERLRRLRQLEDELRKLQEEAEIAMRSKKLFLEDFS
jgi:hypothetical protein